MALYDNCAEADKILPLRVRDRRVGPEELLLSPMPSVEPEFKVPTIAEDEKYEGTDGRECL